MKAWNPLTLQPLLLRRYLEPGGFILFDDSTVDIFGVRNLMPEVLTSGRYKLVAQNPNHLFQKVQD